MERTLEMGKCSLDAQKRAGERFQKLYGNECDVNAGEIRESGSY